MCASTSRDGCAGFGWFGVSMDTTSMACSIPYRIASSFYRFGRNRDIGDTPGAPARGVGYPHFTQAVSRQARTRRGRSSVWRGILVQDGLGFDARTAWRKNDATSTDTDGVDVRARDREPFDNGLVMEMSASLISQTSVSIRPFSTASAALR
jgi:hypothetical protein